MKKHRIMSIALLLMFVLGLPINAASSKTYYLATKIVTDDGSYKPTMTFAYDKNGLLKKYVRYTIVRDCKGRMTGVRYDGDGELERKVTKWNKNGLPIHEGKFGPVLSSTTYSYYKNKILKSITEVEQNGVICIRKFDKYYNMTSFTNKDAKGKVIYKQNRKLSLHKSGDLKGKVKKAVITDTDGDNYTLKYKYKVGRNGKVTKVTCTKSTDKKYKVVTTIKYKKFKVSGKYQKLLFEPLCPVANLW